MRHFIIITVIRLELNKDCNEKLGHPTLFIKDHCAQNIRTLLQAFYFKITTLKRREEWSEGSKKVTTLNILMVSTISGVHDIQNHSFCSCFCGQKH